MGEGVLEKDWDVDAGNEAQEHRPPDGCRQLRKLFKLTRQLRKVFKSTRSYLSQLAIHTFWATRHESSLVNSP